MPKQYIARRAPVRNRTSDLLDGLSRPSLALRNPTFRAVAEPDDAQWILQFRYGPEADPSAHRDGRNYCRTRSALIAPYQEHAGALDPAAVAALEALPERFRVRDAASITTSAGMEAYHVG